MEHRAELDRAPLWFGPGSRLAQLAELLRALGSAPAGELVEAGDVSDLPRSPLRLLWDADTLSPEDLGFLRRHATRAQGGELVLIGDDFTRRGLRSLLRRANVRFLPWPPDIEDLRTLAGGANPVAPPPRPAAQPNAPRAPAAPTAASDDDELAQIESILASGEPPSAPAAPRTTLPAAEGGVAHVEAPPSYFKDQVADLADIAQRIQLALETADEKDSDGLQSVGQEVERLVQFTRTLGYLVSPPTPGTQTFDLSEMVDVFLAGTPKTPDTPRMLFRGGGPLLVRSDRALLSQALDAFLFLASSCAGKGEIVRLQTRAEGELCVLTIQFPPGPLTDVEPEKILQPYGLRRAIPKLGPNALAAATGIVAGQGGRALLERAGSARLGWRIELPRAAGRG